MLRERETVSTGGRTGGGEKDIEDIELALALIDRSIHLLEAYEYDIAPPRSVFPDKHGQPQPYGPFMRLLANRDPFGRPEQCGGWDYGKRRFVRNLDTYENDGRHRTGER